MEHILKAEHITKSFQNQEMILKGIDLEIEPGTFQVLLGPSGSGKSTLLNILSGLLKPSSGKVWCEGIEVNSLSESKLADWKKRRTGNIFQNYLLLNNLTVRENIMLGMNGKGEGLSMDTLVQTLEIQDLLDQFPSKLSGGQQQRAAIARAVIKKPDILFCDEATGALDEENSKKVVKLLHVLQKQYGITILFVTHNLQIAETADRVITIKNGLVASDHRNLHPIDPMEMIWG